MKKTDTTDAWLSVLYVTLLLFDVAHVPEQWLTNWDWVESHGFGGWLTRRIHLLIVAAIPGLYRVFAGRFHAELTLVYGAIHVIHGSVHLWEAIAKSAFVPGLYGGLASLFFGAAVVGVSIVERRRQRAAA